MPHKKKDKRKDKSNIGVQREAGVKFDKVKIDNHQCLFAYFCEKEKEFDFVYIHSLQDLLDGTATVRECFVDNHSIMVQYK